MTGGMTDACHSSSISNKFWGWNPDHLACAGVLVSQRKYGGQGTMPMLFLSVCCLSLGDQTQVVKLDSRCLCPRSHLTGLKLSFRANGQRERWDQLQPAHCFYRLLANKEPTREGHSLGLTPANASWSQLQGLGCLFLYLHVD